MAAKKPPDDSHELIRIDIEQTELKTIPSVSLEQREIKITGVPPPLFVPLVVTVSEEKDDLGDAERNVGETGPLGSESRLAYTRVPCVNGHHDDHPERLAEHHEKPGARLTVEQAFDPQKRKSAHIMEFFEEQERSLQEQFRSLPRRPKSRKPRSPSPSPVRQSVGLDHLDNLVRLMEQLSSLRDENSKLKKRCNYLESTKYLLQAKQTLESDTSMESHPEVYTTLPTKTKTKSKRHANSSEHELLESRDRLPSTEDAEYLNLELLESSSDQAPKRPRHALHKRSFSTGSLEVPSDLLDEEEENDSEKAMSKSFHGKGAKERKSSKSPATKRRLSKMSSKWARVKKVLTGQKLSEDVVLSLKSLKEFGKGVPKRYVLRTTNTGRELRVPTVGIAESRSVDSGVGSGLEAEGHEGARKSTSSADGPSPSGYFERHISDVPDVDDAVLCANIWMGPPEWIEKHEREQQQDSRKGSTGSVLTSDDADAKSSHSSGRVKEDGEHYLKVPIPRRQSSPTLVEEILDPSVDASTLQRTASFNDKNSEIESIKEEMEEIGSPNISGRVQRLHKTAWGKVKNMIHTRKDSMKKKYSRKGGKLDYDLSGGEEMSEEFETEEDLQSALRVEGQYGDGPLGQSTPKTSPMANRHRPEKSLSDSPPGNKGKGPPSPLPAVTPGGSFDVASLIGGVSDEFTKKLQEWEELKTKRSSAPVRAPSEEGTMFDFMQAGAMSPEFQKKMEEWERSKSMKGLGSPAPQRNGKIENEKESFHDTSPEGGISSEKLLGLPINVDDMQRKLTDSFNRKMEEWERVKYQRDGSPQFDRKGSGEKSGIRKEERPKSKKTKGEKEKEKMERQREREIQRMEREQQKLEKEKIRLEKERFKALEREARIEKMKGRLSQPDMDSKYKSPILSPLAECKVTSDFARKLHEWEIIKGSDSSTALYLEAQHHHLQTASEYRAKAVALRSDGFSDDVFTDEPPPVRKKGKKPAPLTLQPCPDSPEERSPADRSSEASFGDDTTVTMESMTSTNISSLEKANAELLETLHSRQTEYASLQEEVNELSDKLTKVKDEHSKEIVRYKEELLTGSPPGQIRLEMGTMSNALEDLEEKIEELQMFGEKLAVSMESAAICKWQSMEGEESVNSRLIDLLEQMRLMLLQASQTEEASKKSSALHSFERLYSQAMQLQMQMNNLRLSQLERNKEIMDMKRQLLLQEANNLLLQADITRRETELYKYREFASKKGSSLKRWYTYSGKDSGDGINPYQRMLSKKEANKPPLVIPEESEEVSGEKTASVPPIVESDNAIDQGRQLAVLDQSVAEEKNKWKSEESQDSIDFCSEPVESSLNQTLSTTMDTSRSSSDGGVAGEDNNVELSKAIPLPATRISPPKDISKHELAVPRTSRSTDGSSISSTGEKTEEIISKRNLSTDLVGEDSSQQMDVNSESSKSEPRFPELLIPEWRKKPDTAQAVDMTDRVVQSDSLENAQTLETSVEVTHADHEILTSSDIHVDTQIKPEEAHVVESSSISRQIPVQRLERPRLEKQRALELESHSETYIPIQTVVDVQSAPLETLSESMEEPMEAPQQSHHDSTVTRTVVRSEDGSRPYVETVTRFQNQADALSRFKMRRTPSPTVQLVTIGPVWPMRRLQPHAELLEDCQRYRSGHSVYMTRILQRYALLEEVRRVRRDGIGSHDKENVTGGYVQTMVKRLSREGTPEERRTGDSTPRAGTSHMTLQRTDSPRSQSEFVQHIVRKLSQPSGPNQTKLILAPLKDVTNEGQVKKLTESFDYGGYPEPHERTWSDSECSRHKSVVVNNKRKSCEIMRCYESSSSSASTLISQSLNTSCVSEADAQKPDSTISSTVNYSSLPLLSAEDEGGRKHRERAATTASCDVNEEPLKRSSAKRQEIQVTVTHVAGPSIDDAVATVEGASSASLTPEVSPLTRRAMFPKTSPTMKRAELGLPKSSQKGGGKIKMGTIGALCQQSISFDLGVSAQVKDEKQSGLGKSKSEESSTKGSQKVTVRPSSTGSDGDIESTSHEGRKKSRRFLDRSWLHKPRRFFKVSK